MVKHTGNSRLGPSCPREMEYFAVEALNRYKEVVIYDSITQKLWYPGGFICIDAERELLRILLGRYGAPGRY
ncbi:MAG TPA: hypothetical protein VFN94_03265 [Nitrospiria bacterium]|nr:hypothetical protein [Nitrospiria bacterium]